MITEITKAQFLALQTARLKDPGSASLSYFDAENEQCMDGPRNCPAAREILGANGIVDDYCVMRHMNNLETVYTYEGTHEMHKLMIGEHITGISASGDDREFRGNFDLFVCAPCQPALESPGALSHGLSAHFRGRS